MKNEEKIYKSMDRVANAIWDGLKDDGNDYTTSSSISAIAKSLNKITFGVFPKTIT